VNYCESKKEIALDGETGELSCAQEDPGEHGAVEAASVGVAQRGVICGQKMQAVGKDIVGPVGEAVGRFAVDDAGVQKVCQVTVKGDFSETDNDPDARKGLDFSGEMRGAVANLLRLWLVAWRGATDDGGDPGMAKFEAVVAVDGSRFAGQAELVQDGVHEVAGAVAGEGTACAVRSVGTRGEPQNQDAGAWVAKAGNGASPVGLVHVGATLGLADTLTIFAQTRTEVAGDDRFTNLLQEQRRTLVDGDCHYIQ
jgi:hypothetical protein